MDVKEEEDLILITFPQIKTEHEVSCMSAWAQWLTFHKYPELAIILVNFVCLSVCAHRKKKKKSHSVQQLLKCPYTHLCR
jgi:hypothetical protein